MRKNSRAEGGTPEGPPKTCGTYINRLIKVEAHEKNGKGYPAPLPTGLPAPEQDKAKTPKTETVRGGGAGGVGGTGRFQRAGLRLISPANPGLSSHPAPPPPLRAQRARHPGRPSSAGLAGGGRAAARHVPSPSRPDPRARPLLKQELTQSFSGKLDFYPHPALQRLGAGWGTGGWGVGGVGWGWYHPKGALRAPLHHWCAWGRALHGPSCPCWPAVLPRDPAVPAPCPALCLCRAHHPLPLPAIGTPRGSTRSPPMVASDARPFPGHHPGGLRRPL